MTTDTTFSPEAYWADPRWADYYARAREDITRRIETDGWSQWTQSDKRYLLASQICIVENDVDGNPSGRVTAHLDVRIYSHTVEDLYRIWQSSFMQNRFETTITHFIADTQERKVIDLLSICA